MSLVRGLSARMGGGAQTANLTLVDVTPTNGVALDGASSAAFLVIIGTGGSQGTAIITFEEASAAITGPFTTIAVADLEFSSSDFTTAAEAIAFGDAGVHYIGYHGTGRWIRATITSTATTPDYDVAIAVITSDLRRAGGTP